MSGEEAATVTELPRRTRKTATEVGTIAAASANKWLVNMTRSCILAAGLWSALLTTCAAAQMSASDKELMRLLARPGRLLLPEELRGNCAGLTVTTKTHIDRLRELEKQAKKAREGPPPSLFGELPAVVDVAKERERVQALNVVLDAKGCQPVNVEEEVKKTPAPTPAPKANGKEPSGFKKNVR